MRRKCRRCNTPYRPCVIDTNGRVVDRRLNSISNAERVRVAWYCPSCTRPYEIGVSEIERHLSLRVGSYMSMELRKSKLKDF